LCKDIEELSVYDLKDHSDYQYRPGTMVIRVSNFTGEDVDSTAGQVIDNYPDGRVRVWWAKGHITMCYPQDLFEINHNDQEHDAYESDGSDGDSWETQSENNLSALEKEDRVVIGMDQAEEAMIRLDKLFRILSPKHKPDLITDLMEVFKNGRGLDRKLCTNFFHVDHFQDIVGTKPTTCEVSPDCPAHGRVEPSPEALAVMTKVSSPLKIELDTFSLVASGQSTSTPTKRKSSTEVDEVQCKKSTDEIAEEDEDQEGQEEEEEEYSEPSEEFLNTHLTESERQIPFNQLTKKYRSEFKELLASARENIAKGFESPFIVSNITPEYKTIFYID